MSSSNSAFNLQGAIKSSPKATNPLALGQSLSAGNPVTNALNAMKTGQPTPMTKVPPPPTAPTNQQITSHTVNADGSIKQTYATDKGGSSASAPKSSGVIQSQSSAVVAPTLPPQTAPTVPAPQPQVQAPQQQTPPNYTGLLGNLRTAATDTSQFDKANSDLENLRKEYATATGNIEGGGYLPLQFVQGREQVLGRQFASQEAAAQSALSSAITARGQTITGLGTAAGLAQPIQASYGNQVLDPTTGKPVNPQAGTDMQTAVNQAAQLIKNGTSYDDAVKTLGAYGQAGVNALQQALGSGFNITNNNAQATATAGTGTQQFQQVQQYRSALQQGQNLQSQLADLITTFGLNPNDVNAANSGIQKIAQNTSDSHYKQLENYVNDIASTYAQVLTPPGGAATDSTRSIAKSMLDLTASGVSILDTMKSLDNAAEAKIAGVQTVNLQQPQNQQSGNQGGGFTKGQTAAGGSLVWDGSSWVVNKK